MDTTAEEDIEEVPEEEDKEAEDMEQMEEHRSELKGSHMGTYTEELAKARETSGSSTRGQKTESFTRAGIAEVWLTWLRTVRSRESP